MGEYVDSPNFELIDEKGMSIVQPHSLGVAAFENTGGDKVFVVHFEAYINSYRRGDAGAGKKCDFILVPQQGYRYIILNEVSVSEPQYVEDFTQPKTGKAKMGKLRTAKEQQLPASIEKLSCADVNFLPCFERRVALFSLCYPCLKAKPRDEAAKSFVAFLSTVEMFANIQMPTTLAHGFVFEQRIYPNKYEL